MGEGATGEGATGEGATGEGATGRGAVQEIVRLGGNVALSGGVAGGKRARRTSRGAGQGNVRQENASVPCKAVRTAQRTRKSASRSGAPDKAVDGASADRAFAEAELKPAQASGPGKGPGVNKSARDGARGTERSAGYRTRLRQLRFAKVLAETGNVAAAAAAAGRTVATVHRWRSEDAAFDAAWNDALAVGYDRLENALLAYALGKIDGVAGGAAGGSISNGDLQLAVGMLQRHRASSGDRRGQALPARMPSEAETDAALKRALDGLARRGKRS